MRIGAPRGPTAGSHPVPLAFLVRARHDLDVTVDLVRRRAGRAVERWMLPGVHPGSIQDVVWDGRVRDAPAPEGYYGFRVTATPAGGELRIAGVVPWARAHLRREFFVSRHAFPVAGPHLFGTGTSRFGGARHHQGQDIVARCGTPLIAAVGGRVQQRGYDSRGGNYVVVDGADGHGQAYMHLRDPSPLREGGRVSTGQFIGRVGETGDATGCHLHFELWTPPGWQRGRAHPVDPLAELQAWDGW
jgi:murein DD-endopeptidase MepM/ murein hydrolase activator NlpD